MGGHRQCPYLPPQQPGALVGSVMPRPLRARVAGVTDVKLNRREIQGRKRCWQSTVINKTNLQGSPGEPVFGFWLGLGIFLVLSRVVSAGLLHLTEFCQSQHLEAIRFLRNSL